MMQTLRLANWHLNTISKDKTIFKFSDLCLPKLHFLALKKFSSETSKITAAVDSALNNPDFERVELRKKIRSTAGSGHIEEALNLFEKHTKLYPKDFDFYVTALVLCKFLKDKETGIMIFDHIKKNYSLNKRVYIDYLKILVACGDSKLFKETIALVPDHLTAQDLLTIVQELGFSRSFKPKKIPFFIDETFVIEICNEIISYGKSKNMKWTPELLDKLAKEYLYFPDSLPNNSIQTIELFNLFKSIDILPTLDTYVKTIESFLRISKIDEALALLSEMENVNYKIPLGTYARCIYKTDPDTANVLVEKLLQQGLEPSEHVREAQMVSYLLGDEDPLKILALFNQIIKENCPTVRSFYIAIRAAMVMEDGNRVMNLWREMMKLAKIQQSVMRRIWFFKIAKFMNKIGRIKDADEVIAEAKRLFPVENETL